MIMLFLPETSVVRRSVTKYWWPLEGWAHTHTTHMPTPIIERAILDILRFFFNFPPCVVKTHHRRITSYYYMIIMACYYLLLLPLRPQRHGIVVVPVQYVIAEIVIIILNNPALQLPRRGGGITNLPSGGRE